MKKNLKLVTVFYITLLTFSLCVGIVYAYESLDAALIGNDFLETFKIVSINNLLIEVGVLSISFLLSFILIGEIIYFIFFLTKSFVLGFMICTFIKVYGLKGILLSSMYFLSQIIIFIVLFFLMFELIKLSKVFIKSILLKNDYDIEILIKSIRKIIFIFIGFILYNVFLYFFQTIIINFFKIIA